MTSVMGIALATPGDLGTVESVSAFQITVSLDDDKGAVAFREHEVLILEKAPAPIAAAQAAKPMAPKSNEQAASAARKKKSSGRASPAGGDEGAGATAGDDEGAIERCTRTIDMLDGQAACEQGASA